VLKRAVISSLRVSLSQPPNEDLTINSSQKKSVTTETSPKTIGGGGGKERGKRHKNRRTESKGVYGLFVCRR